MNADIIKQVQHTSIEERIYLIELILQSLKRDIYATPKTSQIPAQPFQVRIFHLGEAVMVDREQMYNERFV